MHFCCLRRSSGSSRCTRLKDAALITTCLISFVAAFAVAMTTIAHSGARNLAASVSILGSIILVPPVVVSLCLSRFTPSPDRLDRLDDEENAAVHEFLELEQLRWTEFQEFGLGDVIVDEQEVQGVTFQGCLRLSGGMQEVLLRKLELRLELSDSELEEVKHELVALGSIRRCNVLPMLGFVLNKNKSDLLLFMPRLKSLAVVLRETNLGWRSRCRVAALTARGLARLHHGAEGAPVIHGDISSESVHLLEDGDESASLCTPYIVDTGLLKLTSMPVFRVAETSSPRRTEEALSTKLDVHGFGVLLYVLLSGQTDVADLSPLKKRLKKLMDPKLEKLYSSGQAEIIRQTAIRCLRRDPAQRPDMLRVESMLRPLLVHT